MSCVDLLGRTWAPSPAPQTHVPPAAAPPRAPPPPEPELPDPPPLSGKTLSVDEAWAIFGIAQKRAPKDVVKRRYIAFVAKWHPDKPGGSTAQLVRANAAWSLLEKHCRW